jgi:hypothetical protein
MPSAFRAVVPAEEQTQPSGFLGPCTILVAVAGYTIAGKDIVSLELSALLRMLALAVGGLGFRESRLAFAAWRLTRSIRGQEIVVHRRVLQSYALAVPGLDGQLSVYRRAFGFLSDRAWLLRVPARVDFDADVHARGPLSLGGVSLHDPAFDKAFVVRCTSLDGIQLAALLPNPARATIARLFSHGDVATIRFCSDGWLELRFTGGPHDARPIENALPALRALLETIGTRDRHPVSFAALRAHSPTGNPFGFG